MLTVAAHADIRGATDRLASMHPEEHDGNGCRWQRAEKQAQRAEAFAARCPDVLQNSDACWIGRVGDDGETAAGDSASDERVFQTAADAPDQGTKAGERCDAGKRGETRGRQNINSQKDLASSPVSTL